MKACPPRSAVSPPQPGPATPRGQAEIKGPRLPPVTGAEGIERKSGAGPARHDPATAAAPGAIHAAFLDRPAGDAANMVAQPPCCPITSPREKEDVMAYKDIYAGWKSDPEGFWMRAAQAIDWDRAPGRAYSDDGPAGEWFAEAMVNT
ncbi:acetyl-coenzyme A synthetase N-terminal domain-containing protein, partial [Paracoccus sp. (in: a-proteobacteria)]|uniref:acetyl-coenzyme A synthetase N-terminal domain-containing protein n=1 Tax=Paracoccus sp. TaxID=267 RepID=UPI0040589925